MQQHQLMIPVGRDEVSAVICEPSPTAPDQHACVLLAHGAANDRENPLLVYLAEGLSHCGYLTLRFNFPYKEKGRSSPDALPKLTATWQGAVALLREKQGMDKARMIAAGKSMGGRVAAQAVADGALSVDRLVYLGYPLHAPGKKEQLRDAPLYAIKVPMLFFCGTRDVFCDLKLLRPVLERLTAPHGLQVIQDGDHSFNIPKTSAQSQQEVYQQIQTHIVKWLGDGDR